VLRASGHDDDIAGGNGPPLTHKSHLAVAFDEDQNSIGPDVDLLSDFATGRHAHENELGALGRVQHAPEVRVAACELLYGGRARPPFVFVVLRDGVLGYRHCEK
jgi:hypothetical protein